MPKSIRPPRAVTVAAEALGLTRRLLIPGLVACAAVLALGVSTPASADRGRDFRPDYCDVDHDHRSHAADYYDYYPADRFYRAGRTNRNAGLRYRHDPYAAGFSSRRQPFTRRSKLVSRDIFATRGRASIVVTEEVVFSRRGARRVCTVAPRGPDRNLVPYRRLQRIANRSCSRFARVRIY